MVMAAGLVCVKEGAKEEGKRLSRVESKTSQSAKQKERGKVLVGSNSNSNIRYCMNRFTNIIQNLFTSLAIGITF